MSSGANDRLLRIEAGARREQFVPLLLLADESERQVRGYLQQGDLYAFEVDGRVAGVVLTLPYDDRTAELKAVAVETTRQNQGIGTRMVNAVLQDLRARTVRRALVGTSNSGIDQIAWYQRLGFRLLRIERDFFSPDRGYPPAMEENGIRLRDMVWMDLSLQP